MYSLETKKRRTTGYSFRIYEECLEIMRKEAEREGISVNALMNRILERYCKHYRFSERFNTIYLSQNTFAKIIDSCPKDRIMEIAEDSGSNRTRDALETISIPKTYNGLMTFFCENLSEFAGWYDCYCYKNEGRKNLHLRHELGKKWSDFIAKHTSTSFSSILNIETKTETFPNYADIQIYP